MSSFFLKLINSPLYIHPKPCMHLIVGSNRTICSMWEWLLSHYALHNKCILPMYPKFNVFVDKMLMPLSIDVQAVKDVNIMVRCPCLCKWIRHDLMICINCLPIINSCPVCFVSPWCLDLYQCFIYEPKTSWQLQQLCNQVPFFLTCGPMDLICKVVVNAWCNGQNIIT